MWLKIKLPIGFNHFYNSYKLRMASYLNLQESIEQQVSLIKTNNSANKYTL